jgi:hypothetical protein
MTTLDNNEEKLCTLFSDVIDAEFCLLPLTPEQEQNQHVPHTLGSVTMPIMYITNDMAIALKQLYNSIHPAKLAVCSKNKESPYIGDFRFDDEYNLIFTWLKTQDKLQIDDLDGFMSQEDIDALTDEFNSSELNMLNTNTELQTFNPLHYHNKAMDVVDQRMKCLMKSPCDLALSLEEKLMILKN